MYYDPYNSLFVEVAWPQERSRSVPRFSVVVRFDIIAMAVVLCVKALPAECVNWWWKKHHWNTESFSRRCNRNILCKKNTIILD